MIVEPRAAADSWDHFEHDGMPLRVVVPGTSVREAGKGWSIVAPEAAPAADCWLVDSGNLALVSLDEIARSGLPLVLAVGNEVIDAAWLDSADGFVMPEDDDAVVQAVLVGATTPIGGYTVADGSGRTINSEVINALSIDASRIAEKLALLAAARDTIVPARGVDAALVRRIIRLRRDRDRYFPAEIFADPAWNMLLDLVAAQLENKRVPVSSLCIAAAVPTTTALRWVRSLSEAGLIERRNDPNDARRSYVQLAPQSLDAMMTYLRGFVAAFSVV